jgi:hypothetical protein
MVGLTCPYAPKNVPDNKKKPYLISVTYDLEFIETQGIVMDAEQTRTCPLTRQGKPAFWWAIEKEPWRRVSVEASTAEKRNKVEQKIDVVLFSLLQIAGMVLTAPPPDADWE